MKRHILRRDALKAALVAISSTEVMGQGVRQGREVRAFRLIEAAGLRRFGYPVQSIVPDASGGRNFRLLRDGKAIPAQFRESRGTDGRSEVTLDFIASPGPWEVGRYEVHFGSEIEPGPEPKGGLAIREAEGRVLVTLGGTMTFEIDRDPSGFLRSVGSPRLNYLGEVPGGIRLLTRGDVEPPASTASDQPALEVVRHGPMAVGLRSIPPGSKSPAIRLDMTIPSSKTWIAVVASVIDPSGIIRGLELDLDLRVEGSPTLVDLGAGSTIYGQIQGMERMELVAGRAIGEAEPAAGEGWVVRKGEGTTPAIFAASMAGESRPAEGWAHVMDGQRCSALALADFGKAGARDRIAVGADGRARITREYCLGAAEPPRGPKSIAFWLHCVPMPVQVGALTSPQSMMTPLPNRMGSIPDPMTLNSPPRFA